MAVSAVNDLIVVAYQNGSNSNQNLIISYRSSNTIFGGNGTAVCQPQGSNNPMIYHLAMQEFSQGPLSNLQVLSNGQVFVQSTTNDIQMIQLNPYYTLNGQITLNYTAQDSGQTLNITVLTANAYTFNSSNFATWNITGYVSATPKGPVGWNWAYFGAIFGGLVVIVGVLGVLCSMSTQKARDENSRLIEV